MIRNVWDPRFVTSVLDELDEGGIEHCARSPGELNKNDAGLPLSYAQLDASVKVAAFCVKTFNISIDRVHILGHKEADVKTDHSDCPDGAAQPRRNHRVALDVVSRSDPSSARRVVVFYLTAMYVLVQGSLS